MAQRRATDLRWRIIRPLFELLYRNRLLYWLASTLPFAGQWRVWQRLVIPRITGREILELGCGIGTLQCDLCAAGFETTAIDRSPQMVAATRDRLRRHGYTRAANAIQQGSAQQLPFPAERFDTILSTFPTDYIADHATLAEVARTLRPGGRLIIILGAALLPTSALLLPLVALQSLVYGSAARHAPAATFDPQPHGPLADRLRAVGLSPSREQARGPFWIATIYLAQKSAAPTTNGQQTMVQ